MRTQFLGAAIALTLSQAAATADLTIHVTNISKPEGEIAWVLFDSEAGYKADSEHVLSLRRRVDGESMRVKLHDLPAGEYAVKHYHDANRNRELDTNMIGIPTEGYGFSNNAGRFGPPSFEDAAVVLEEDTEIEIRVR